MRNANDSTAEMEAKQRTLTLPGRYAETEERDSQVSV